MFTLVFQIINYTILNILTDSLHMIPGGYEVHVQITILEVLIIEHLLQRSIIFYSKVLLHN